MMYSSVSQSCVRGQCSPGECFERLPARAQAGAQADAPSVAMVSAEAQQVKALKGLPWLACCEELS